MLRILVPVTELVILNRRAGPFPADGERTIATTTNKTYAFHAACPTDYVKILIFYTIT
jgi:hypothetical protein